MWDGPERGRVEGLVCTLGLEQCVRVLGHRLEQEMAQALSRAACLAMASERDGYGLVTVEAAARGTPSVVVAGPDNVAVELVQDGVNGAVTRSASPEDPAPALLRVIESGRGLRASTAERFAATSGPLSLERSLQVVLRSYGEAPAPQAAWLASA
jgi:glycosyltransferase involved in cell wall biosynthesis